MNPKGMTGLAVQKLLKRDVVTRRCYQDILAADQLPKHFKPGVYVVNTDPRSMPGQHWVVFYKTKTRLEFFDSFGHKPSHYNSNWPKVSVYNSKRIQGQEPVCGLYCIYYAILRCRRKTMSDIVSRFLKDTRKNDAFVKFFIKNHFKMGEL